MGLTLSNVDVVYGGVIQVLRSANLEVPDGKMVVLLGSNGAGKTTTLKAISGLLQPELGRSHGRERSPSMMSTLRMASRTTYSGEASFRF